MGRNGGRELDLVLLGATGFVGRLTAAHLAEHAPAGVRIGLAGRSADRLAALRDDLGAGAADWALDVVDVAHSAGLDALAARTRVLLSTVGPYLRHGLPVVQACAAAGTHYGDLTGETVFVRRSIDTCHEAAVRSGAMIVHSCGFDSVPSDLAVGLAATQAEEDGTGPLAGAVLRLVSGRGGVSGGTIDSLRLQLDQMRADADLRRLVGSQLALTDATGHATRPEGGAGAPRGRGLLPHRDSRTGRWQAPYVMGAYNGQVVQRTNELAGWAYGRGFGYREVVDTGRGPRGAVLATAVTLGTGGLLAGLALPPTRAVLDRLLPKPGEGPSEATMAGGRFRLELDAWTQAGQRYRSVVATDRDPGYGATAVMLAQSGLALALDDLGDRAGVVTPMVALGEALAMRLRQHAFTVETGRATLNQP